MDKILQEIFNTGKDISINELSDKYYKLRTPFTGLIKPEITYESWQYAVKHLPLSIFIQNNRSINYILHLPGDHYLGGGQKYTFSGMPLGWSVYAGESIKCECRLITDTCCEIHINMRDIYTDICEFISNLLLHIKFMELNKGEVIVIYKNNDCKEYGECGAIFKSMTKEYEKIDKSTIINEISLQTPPKYNVKINNINNSQISRAHKVIVSKFENIYNELFDVIKQRYKSKNFKVHIIQAGNGTPLWDIPMLHHPKINISDVKLHNKYGGKYEMYDRYIAKIMKISDYKTEKGIYDMNKKWYYYKYFFNYNPYSILFLNKIPVSKTMDPILIDLVNSIDKKDNIVILNIPYSFGSEAYNIGKAIQNVFGKNLCSFQVIGKAGGIGNKNKLNDYIIADKLSIAYPSIFKINKEKEIINLNKYNLDTTLASGQNVKIFNSGCKNMPCVLFEEKKYLKNISKQFNAIEMEGFWYSYGLKQSLPQIYLYYISDLPLKVSLAHENYPINEGQTLFNGLLRMGLKWIKDLETLNKNVIRNRVIMGVKNRKKTKRKSKKKSHKGYLV